MMPQEKIDHRIIEEFEGAFNVGSRSLNFEEGREGHAQESFSEEDKEVDQ